MKRINSRLLSWLLAALMLLPLLGSLSSCRKKTPIEDLPEVEEPNLSDVDLSAYTKELKYYDTDGASIVRAIYSKELTATQDAPYHQLVKNHSTAPDAAVSAIWNADGLLLTITYNKGELLYLSCGTFSTTVTPTEALTQFTLTPQQMGLTIADLGQYIPLNIILKADKTAAQFEGFARLYAADIEYVELCSSMENMTSQLSVLGSPNAVTRGMDAGVELDNGDFIIYDRYSLAKNAAKSRVMLSSPSIEGITNLAKDTILELDLQINSMPKYEPEFFSPSNAFGLCFTVASADTQASALCGIINSDSGLRVFANTGTQLMVAPLGKQVGDQFHLSILAKASGGVFVYVDDREVAAFDLAIAERSGFAEKSLHIFWQRNAETPISDADNFEARIDNLAVSFEKTTYIADTITIEKLFGGKTVSSFGNGIYIAPAALQLDTSVTSKKYDVTTNVHWSVTNREVISTDGTVTAPLRAGEIVDVTCYLFGGDYVASERTFRFFVKATDPVLNTMYIPADNNPYVGTGTPSDTCVELVSGSSIVYDMGSVQDIWSIRLRGLKNEPLFIAKNFIAIYESNDNISYRRVEDFSMLQADS